MPHSPSPQIIYHFLVDLHLVPRQPHLKEDYKWPETSHQSAGGSRESRSNIELGNHNGAHGAGGVTGLKYVGCDQLKSEEEASRG